MKTWTLLDAEVERLEKLSFGPEEAGGAATGYGVFARQRHGGLREGVFEVLIENGKLAIAVLPTRGMGIRKIYMTEAALTLGWKSPVAGPVNPQFVPLWEPSGIGWLSGFDEFLCRCGLESNGAPEWGNDGKLKYPLHGKIANTPAHKVELAIDGDTGEIALTGIVDEARLYGSKLRLKSTIRTRVGESSLRISDEITNLSAEPGECELLYHINVGQPLLENGAKIVAPIKTLVPRNARAVEDLATWDSYGSPQPGFAEQVYFFDLAADADGRTQVLLRNAHGLHGMTLAFNKKQLPTFTLWKSTQAAEDGYVTGLEPGINFPNPRSFEKEQGRVAALKPGQTLKFELEIGVLSDAESVAAAEKAIARLQAAVTPKIFDRPMPGWTSG
jgi:hypothetical protein